MAVQTLPSAPPRVDGTGDACIYQNQDQPSSFSLAREGCGRGGGRQMLKALVTVDKLGELCYLSSEGRLIDTDAYRKDSEKLAEALQRVKILTRSSSSESL